MSSATQPQTFTVAQRLTIVDGAYRTPPRRVPWLDRSFPSTAFYLRFFASVWRASRLAKHGKYDAPAWGRSSHEVLHALESVGVDIEITGVEHLQALTTPCLVVGNHMSTLETALLPGVIQPIRDITFVVKSSLMDLPVFKYIMRSRDPIVVSQTNPREDLKTMLSQGAERLSRGISVVVFPQGRRTLQFDPADFNTIGVKLAQRTGVPIIPLALKTDAWPTGRRIPDIGVIDPAKKVRFAFGPPLWVDGRGTEENRAIIDFIQVHLRRWEVADK